MEKSRSFIATPPGVTIKEQLDERGMSQKEFSSRMEMSEKHISKLINGSVQLTHETAYKLEMVLGVPAEFWNRLEAIYREKVIRAEAENAMDADIIIARKLPYVEMSKLGWIASTKDIHERVMNLRKFFEVVSLSLLGNEKITCLACRRLAITEKGDLALMAWAQEVKIVARDMHTSPINVQRLIDSVPEIRKMTLLQPDQFSSDLKEILAKCGIALVYLPHLKGSFLQGASFLDGNKVVIGLTVRGKDADKFWFSLFHELAHVILGHVGKTGGTSDLEEKDADRWASETLIPSGPFKILVAEKDFSERRITKFAEDCDIAPGIVIGRLQSEKIISYNRLNHLNQKYQIS